MADDLAVVFDAEIEPAVDGASESLTEAYSELLAAGGLDLGGFEDRALSLAHEAAARAYAAALERRGAELRASLPEGTRAHDRRRRTLATRLGDVTFRLTRCVDGLGLRSCPLLDELDLPYGARVSPSAASLLVELASDVSYARAGRTLGRCGGSRVSASAVMRLMRSAGELCAAEDAEAARDLFVGGVLPGGSQECAELRLEADGTWLDLQGKDREQALRYDPSALERVHVGCDGEAWCKASPAMPRMSTEGWWPSGYRQPKVTSPSTLRRPRYAHACSRYPYWVQSG